MATGRVERVGVLERRRTGAAVRSVRDGVEYVRDARALPRLRAPVAMDVVLAV